MSTRSPRRRYGNLKENNRQFVVPSILLVGSLIFAFNGVRLLTTTEVHCGDTVIGPGGSCVHTKVQGGRVSSYTSGYQAQRASDQLDGLLLVVGGGVVALGAAALLFARVRKQLRPAPGGVLGGGAWAAGGTQAPGAARAEGGPAPGGTGSGELGAFMDAFFSKPGEGGAAQAVQGRGGDVHARLAVAAAAVAATAPTTLSVMVSVPCTACGATGGSAQACGACAGQGRVPTVRNVTFQLPAGARDGSQVRLAGQGEAGVRGGAPGDLYVRLQVRPEGG
jgi:DnaJ C terminal domain